MRNFISFSGELPSRISLGMTRCDYAKYFSIHIRSGITKSKQSRVVVYLTSKKVKQ